MRRTSRTVWSGLAVGVTGILIAGGGWAPAASPKRRPVNAQIVANFAQFRRARTGADVLPPITALAHLQCQGPGPAQPGNGLAAIPQIDCTLSRAVLAQYPRGQLLGPRVLHQVIYGLQRDQSRAVWLPGRLGTIWLIPSGRWLCNLFRSRFVLGPSRPVMACEQINEVFAEPPLYAAGIYGAASDPFSGGYLFALEPDRFTNVTVNYLGGSQRTYLANNVLGACIGHGSSWLTQTGPLGTVTTVLDSGNNGQPTPYHPKRCPRLPRHA